MEQFKFKLDRWSALLLFLLVVDFIALPVPSYVLVESAWMIPITVAMIFILNIGAIVFILRTHRHV